MIEIELIDSEKPANNIYLSCSTLKTGYMSNHLVKENSDSTLFIENIQEKYSELFDDITYYTLGNNTIIGG